MTPNEFVKCMGVLSAGVGRDIPEATSEVWFSVLGDLTAKQLQAGIVKTLQTHRFAGFPPVAVIRENSGCGITAAGPDDRAAEAWGIMLDAMRRIGGYQSVEWDDPAIPAAIEAVSQSWPALCELPSAELHAYVRPRWIQSYKAAVAIGSDGPTVSAGILATDAGRLGGTAPTPLRIGQHPAAVTGFLEEPEAEPIARIGQLVEFASIPAGDEKPRSVRLTDAEVEARRSQQIADLKRLIRQ